MVSTALITSLIVALVAIALGGAYMTGALDPVIEQIGVLFFKAEAKAEEKKLEAQGQKEGEDFVKGELAGNQKAGDFSKNLGGLGGGIGGDFKKGL